MGKLGRSTATGSMLITNVEACKFCDSGACVAIEATYLGRHSFVDGFKKMVNLVFRALDHELDATVRQVAYVSGDIEVPGNRACGVAKTDSLNMSRVEDLPSLKG